MEEIVCRWCLEELPRERRWMHFCCSDCGAEWQNVNSQGRKSKNKNIWFQDHENGVEVYSMLSDEIWNAIWDIAFSLWSEDAEEEYEET